LEVLVLQGLELRDLKRLSMDFFKIPQGGLQEDIK
jgi:hypothetical protein